MPKEIRNNEFRVWMTPGAVAELTHRGHAVLVESGAGTGIGLVGDEYRCAGATIASGLDEVFAAEMIVKMKEPLVEERKRLRPA